MIFVLYNKLLLTKHFLKDGEKYQELHKETMPACLPGSPVEVYHVVMLLSGCFKEIILPVEVHCVPLIPFASG